MTNTIRNLKRGFNLVEAAIVLGVVGLVIGGIWVAASSVSRNHQINTTYTNVGSIITGLQNLYGSTRLPTAFTDLTPSMISAGIIPADMILGGTAKHVWGGAFELIKPAGLNAVYMTFYNVPSSICPELLMKLTGQVDAKGYGRFGLMYTNISGDSSSTLNAIDARIDPTAYLADAAATCKSSDGKATMMVYFAFPY